MFKKILLAGAASALMLGGAQAADIIEPTAYDWTGPYIGLQGGYAWGENDASAEALIDEVILFASEDVTLNGEEGSIAIDGFVGGVHAGYNWQSDSLVLGLEGDIEFADIDGDTDVVDDGGGSKEKSSRRSTGWARSDCAPVSRRTVLSFMRRAVSRLAVSSFPLQTTKAMSSPATAIPNGGGRSAVDLNMHSPTI